jgi:hypothetical protein
MQQIIGMVVILSCLVLSVAAFMQFGGGGLGGGGLNNLIKPNTIQQAGQADECKIKCGGPAGCEKGRADHAAGTIPPSRADFWSWCSGVPSSTVSTTSKEKFGQACCPI